MRESIKNKNHFQYVNQDSRKDVVLKIADKNLGDKQSQGGMLEKYQNNNSAQCECKQTPKTPSETIGKDRKEKGGFHCEVRDRG